MMNKEEPKIYILPSWGGRISDDCYQKIIHIAEKKGYRYIPLRVATRNRKYSLGNGKKYSEIIHTIAKQIKRPCATDIVIGFSIGALQAYQLATILKFKKLIICSLSTILGKDLSMLPRQEFKDLSDAQYKELLHMRYGKLKTTKGTILYGEKESLLLRKRSQRLGKRKGYSVVKIKDGDHILDAQYVKAIEKAIS